MQFSVVSKEPDLGDLQARTVICRGPKCADIVSWSFCLHASATAVTQCHIYQHSPLTPQNLNLQYTGGLLSHEHDVVCSGRKRCGVLAFAHRLFGEPSWTSVAGLIHPALKWRQMCLPPPENWSYHRWQIDHGP